MAQKVAYPWRGSIYRPWSRQNARKGDRPPCCGSARELGWRFEVWGATLQIAESVVADERGQPSRAQQLIIAPAYEGLEPQDRAMHWMFYQEGAKP